MLYMAALVGTRHNAVLRAFHARLIAAGKRNDGTDLLRKAWAQSSYDRLQPLLAERKARSFDGKINEAYGLIAEQMKGANMVSQGSADYIAALDFNEDVDDPTMWLGEDGYRWEKNECDVVDIVSWTFPAPAIPPGVVGRAGGHPGGARSSRGHDGRRGDPAVSRTRNASEWLSVP